MLKIHETTTAEGRAATFLVLYEGSLAVVEGDVTRALPPGSLDEVMSRYGAPLEESARLSVVASLTLPGGRVLRHVRHRAWGDVIARDFLVDDVPERTPLCALATTIAAALSHLARAAQSAPL